VRRNTNAPSEPGEKFSYTFTGQESLGLFADDMLQVAGREVKGICAKGQYGNVAQAIKKNHPHGVNKHNFLVSAVKYCVAHPLNTAGGMQKFFSSGARPPTGATVFVFVGNVTCLFFLLVFAFFSGLEFFFLVRLQYARTFVRLQYARTKVQKEYFHQKNIFLQK